MAISETQLQETFDLLELIGRSSGRISIIGSMNADYTVTTERFPGPGETVNGGPLTILPGGKSANQAAAAAHIGAEVTMFGSVGFDGNAEFLLSRLRDAGVDVGQVSKVPGPSVTTVITVDANGENTIVYSAGSNAKVDIDYVHDVQDKLLESTVLGLCLESPMETVCECARLCHGNGIRVLLNNSPFVPELPKELIENSDVLLLNEHEMAQLLKMDEPDEGDWGCADWRKIATQLEDFGYQQAIITLGGDGSVVIDGGEIHRVQAFRVKAVDTTGCGDAFMGTVCAGLAGGLSLEDSARIGSLVSAYAATGHGAQASYGSVKQIKDYFG